MEGIRRRRDVLWPMVTDAIEKFNEAMEIGDGPSIHRNFGIMQSKADRMIALDEDITSRITEGTTSMTNEEMNEELKDIEMAHSCVIDVRIQYDLYIQSTEQKFGRLRWDRAKIRRSFTNIGKKIDAVLTVGGELMDGDLDELTSLFQLLTVRNDELVGKDSDYLEILELDEAKEKELNAEQDKVDEYNLKLLKYKTVDVPYLDDDRSEIRSSSSDSKKCKYKLPILQLKNLVVI
ncbi:hypothetical protein GE061_016467 [Apolygus lucorum]|uniref:Uncharacterized protein n=1 Tax=Apolygus lucorum TaxID=248454 RepID=A0A8S9XID6_APOLU|nr:hypothetical protein GE061_016467 [Apolygus lucorum]